jgi:hypothetical protein
VTELLFSIKSPDSFHRTTYQSREVFALADDWAEVRTRLPAFVAADLGLPEPVDQYRAFAVTHGYETTRPDDPLILLPEIYRQLTDAHPNHRQYVQEHAADLFMHVFAKELVRMEEWWHEGYFPRHDTLIMDGNRYDIYNHRRTLQFTGDVQAYGLRNLTTGVMEQWYYAQLDTSPLMHEDGYVPYDEGAKAILLPSMANEPYVGRNLANAHIAALRASVAPWILNQYAPGFGPK